MAVLSRAAALACLAACYSPDVRDCSVTCESSADCAGAQVCGGDHFCAMPEIAGTCAHQQAMPDAGDAPPDAARDAGVTPPADAALPDAPPDAPATGALHLKVGGHGQLVAGVHTCTMDCTFQVPLVTIDVVAVGLGDQVLDKWTEGPCVGSHAMTCTVTPPVTVGAKFHKDDDH
jgi:hypothetical protein